jgi:hypothetical protein
MAMLDQVRVLEPLLGSEKTRCARNGWVIALSDDVALNADDSAGAALCVLDERLLTLSESAAVATVVPEQLPRPIGNLTIRHVSHASPTTGESRPIEWPRARTCAPPRPPNCRDLDNYRLFGAVAL